MNLDPKEIEKFNQLAAKWWDESGDMAPLHRINPVRLEFLQKNCKLTNKKVLDIGCGGGLLTEALAKQGAIVTGIDAAPDAIKIAKQHALQNELNINYYTSTAEDFLAQSDEKFDIVCCLEMLEHVPSPESVIATASKLTKPKGDLFFSTINRNPKAYLFGVLAAEYILGLLPKGTHDYKKFIRPYELAKMCKKAGLKILTNAGIYYNPIFDHCKLTTNLDINYISHAKYD